ncbi:MAG: N-acetyltransferase [Microbacteriaceae bacterium]|jgi:predicted GNAT family acetyltransferase|nr:N-acetyltransferase [Microbacteriaceae bacterium]HEV7956488.1 GNAT family N-acetyltransferase [Marisediminicola sp.]
MSTDLQRLAGQSRYVFSSNGVQVGVIDYVVRGTAIHLIHAEIDPRSRGAGLGAQMVQGVLEMIRAETDYRVVADCPFVIDFLRRHPDYQELESR